MDVFRRALRCRLVRELLLVTPSAVLLAVLMALPIAAGHADARPLPELQRDRSRVTGPMSGRAGEGAMEPSVIGGDDRTRVTATTLFPYSAIAAIEAYDDDGQLVETCSGAFVGPNAVLTAGHCLWSPVTRAWAMHVRVVPAKDGAIEPFGSQFATDWWVPDAFIDADGDSDQDWGLIRLPDDHLARDAHWLALRVFTDDQLEAPGFAPEIAGYPTDLGDGTMWRDSAAGWAAIGADTLAYAIDTGPGESGAPVWSSNAASPGYAQVAGIHTWASEQPGQPNSGVRITNTVIADLREACRQLACTIEVATGAPGGSPAPRFRVVAPGIARDG